MPDSRIHVVANFAVKAELAIEFIERARATLVEPTQAEPGCIAYQLCQDAADPTKFAMIETWETREHLEAHLAQESLQTAVAALAPMAAEAPSVGQYRSVA